MPQKPPIGADAAIVTDEAFRIRAEIDLDVFYQRLVNETRRLITDLSQQGLTGDALASGVEDGLRNLSDQPIIDMGRASTAEAFNLGRNIAAQQNIDAIGGVVRTEILDENTCGPCELEDGGVFQMNTPEYFQHMPPNGCEGRERCRGFYMYRGAA
jgi:hypothetical protein